MLNDRRFRGHAFGPSLPGKTLHRFIHCGHGHAARRSALPRESYDPTRTWSKPHVCYSAPSQSSSRLAARNCSELSAPPELRLYLARSHAGEKAISELQANATRLMTKQWPYAIIELYLTNELRKQRLKPPSHPISAARRSFTWRVAFATG